jgi:hypothetical protein
MRFPWPRRRHDNRNASPEAKAAREQAERSKRQAEVDRVRSRRNALTARPIVEQAKRHNKANHFDQWLQDQLRNGHT